MRIISLLTLSCALLHAAPSTDLGNEIQTPLESSSGFALVDKASGSIRLIRVNASNVVTLSQPKHSSLPNVTGVTSGLNSGGNERIILSSPTANRAALFDTSTFISTPLLLSQVGPQFPAIVKKAPAGPKDLILAHTFNSITDPFLTLHRDPPGTFNLLDDTSGSESVSAMLPFYTSGAAARYVAGVVNDGATNRLFYGGINVADTIEYFTSNLIPVGTLLASNVRRSDNLLMLVGYVPGSANLSIIPVNAPPALGAPITRTLPFTAGSVAPAPPGIGSAGILVTSADGSKAAHYSITPANTLSLVQSFASSGSDLIHGLVPVPGRGIIQLTGLAGSPSTGYMFSVWNGTSSSWALKTQGALPPLTDPTPEFATLFWYSAEPLVDPTAQLIKLEIAPDWTSKSAAVPIPANIFTETYLSPSAGLAVPTTSVPTPPAGAAHLVTNQFLDSISLASLDNNLSLTLPPLSVSPASGSYTQAVFLTAATDDDLYEIYFRNGASGYAWQLYSSPRTISYSSTWQFYAKNKTSGINGPITSRSFTFDTAAITTFDSDHDGVPDFVETANGLNPLAGADTDADGYSDLDELLNGSNPNDQNSTPASSTSPFNGEGFLILAQAFNTTPDEASDGDPASPADLTDGTVINLSGLTSNFLAADPIEPLSTPVSLTGDLAATLEIGTPIPVREWLTLSSPQYFDIDGAAPQVRSGREIYKIIQRPVQSPPTITSALTGLDEKGDAAAWIAAAKAAYGSYEQVSTITPLAPTDTAVAVLGEAILYDALLALDASQQMALGVPQTIPADAGPPATLEIPGYVQFTLYGKRDGDASRTALTREMLDALIADGLSLEKLLTDININVSISSNLLTLTNAIYDFHVAHSEPTAALPGDVIPLLSLPLDILRGVARGEALPSDYVGVVSKAVLIAAKSEMAAVLTLRTGAYRPTATWTVTVSAPVIPGEEYAYIHGNSKPVALYEADGDLISLDQGLGLALGTRFSVTGYTDAVGPAGHIAMELLSINVLFVPAASDSDADGNLLADDWEKFFFGGTGVVNPYDIHPVNGYSYIQLYIIGHDPRADCNEIPAVPIAVLAPDQMTIIKLPSGNYALNFTFPDTYFSSFEFDVEISTTLMNFEPLTTGDPVRIGVDTYHINLGSDASSGSENFFRIRMFLPEVGDE